MRFAELNLKREMSIQIVITILIVVLWSFVLPASWQPFYGLIGDIFGAESGVAVAALSPWFFGFCHNTIFGLSSRIGGYKGERSRPRL